MLGSTSAAYLIAKSRVGADARQSSAVSGVFSAGFSTTAHPAADSQLACREVFGPVCAIATFDQIDDAFEVADSTPFGLQAGIFTNSIATAMRAAHRLEFGSVTINEAPEWRADEIPYGGVKASGNTKEGPMAAIREMTQERLVVIAVGS